MSLRFQVALLAIATLLGAACGIATPSDNKVDEISGTIPVGGTDSKDFTLSKSGEIQVTMSTLTPSPSASLGMGIGQPTSVGCTLMQGYIGPLVANRTQEFGFFNKGTFCLLLFDTGNLTVPTAYTGKISHP